MVLSILIWVLKRTGSSSHLENANIIYDAKSSDELKRQAASAN
jgi:hypothetical protein